MRMSHRRLTQAALNSVLEKETTEKNRKFWSSIERKKKRRKGVRSTNKPSGNLDGV